MPHLRSASATLAFVLSMLGQASATPSSTATESIALDYRAPANCPDAADFEAQIRAFIPSVSVRPRAASTRAFEISIDESGTVGELRLSTEQGGGSRNAHGSDCSEVARLLAFAVALVLDPQLQLEASGSDGDVAPEPPRLDPGILPRPLPALLTLSTPPSVRRDHQPPKRRASSKHGIAATASIASALAPSTSYGVGALYGVTPAWGALKPQLRLGASYSASADAHREGATIEFFEVLGAVEGCPATLDLGAIALWPCLRVDWGARSTSSSDIPRANTRVRPWVSVDALLHARIRLGSGLFIELGGGAMLPALRDRLFLEPDLEIHRVPALGFLGQMAMGIEFADRNRN